MRTVGRERVIVDIEDVGQAAKVEESVATGYCDSIRDNLTHWIAVEEDIVDSYTHPSGRLVAQAEKNLAGLTEESRKTITTLRDLLRSFEELGDRRSARVKLLKDIESRSRH